MVWKRLRNGESLLNMILGPRCANLTPSCLLTGNKGEVFPPAFRDQTLTRRNTQHPDKVLRARVCSIRRFAHLLELLTFSPKWRASTPHIWPQPPVNTITHSTEDRTKFICLYQTEFIPPHRLIPASYICPASHRQFTCQVKPSHQAFMPLIQSLKSSTKPVQNTTRPSLG